MATRTTLLTSLFLTLFIGNGLFAIDQPAEIRDGAGSCESQLIEMQRITGRNLRAERVGLWERLRALRDRCAGSDVDPSLRARAALVYQVLPEYSALAPRIAMLGEIQSQLTSLSKPAPELIEILDLTGSSLSVEGRPIEAERNFEEALSLRREIYGSASAEYAEGLLVVARFHAMSAETSSSDRDVALQLSDEALTLAASLQGTDPAKKANLRAQVVDLYEQLELSSESIQERVRQVDARMNR